MTVASVMTREFVTISARQDAKEAARLMLDRQIRALPVLEEDVLVGIVTETDVLRAFVKAA